MTGTSVPMTSAHGAARVVLLPVLAAGVALLAVAALTMQVASGGELLANYLVVDVVLAAVNTALGSLLWRRVPSNPIGPLYTLSGTAYGVTAALTAWVTGAVEHGWPGVAAAAWAAEWCYVFALAPQLTLLLLLFPDGRPPGRRWRWVVWASVAVSGLLVLAFMAVPQVHVGPDDLVPSPLGGLGWADAAAGPLLLALGVCGLASVTALVTRAVRAAAPQRRTMAPYLTAALVALGALAAVPLLPPLWEPVVQTLTLPLLPAAATLGILRYRLYDAEVVVRRSVVWLALSLLVVAGYAMVVQALATMLQREAGLPESLLAVGVVAAAFQPTRLWLQGMVGRLLYGERDEPASALTGLGQTLAATAEPGTALAGAARRTASALALPWVAVEVDRGSDEPFLAESGHRPVWAGDTDLAEIPLRHGGSPQGRLLACRRSPGETLGARDLELLSTLAYPVAATAAAYRLTDDLRRSRERVVQAREEERRRLRHDLHDDLAPLLASFRLQLDAATLRHRRTGELPDAVLDELRRSADEAAATVRRSVELLRSPALGELGLRAALDEQVARLRTPDGPELRAIVPDDLPVLPAATEVAALRIATEGLTNAVRHARARHVSVRVAREGSSLAVVVEDDGRGIHTPGQGLGMLSMRERAEELGGSLLVESGVHGTRLRAVLPGSGS